MLRLPEQSRNKTRLGDGLAGTSRSAGRVTVLARYFCNFYGIHESTDPRNRRIDGIHEIDVSYDFHICDSGNDSNFAKGDYSGTTQVTALRDASFRQHDRDVLPLFR